MNTLAIFAAFFVLSDVTEQTCTKNMDVLIYKRSPFGTSQWRLTTIFKGKFKIQAFLTLTDGGQHCKRVTRDGVVKVFALKYAIKKANKLLSNYSIGPALGLHIDDICMSMPVAMSRGIELVSKYQRNYDRQSHSSNCGKIEIVDDQPALAVIGAEMSYITTPLASLMSLYSIPHVSFAASSRLLSDKKEYRSFFRTIPSDANLIRVMVDIFRKFKWNYVFAIGDDDAYGRKAIADLKSQGEAQRVCFNGEGYIPHDSYQMDRRINEIIEKIRAAKQATVVVLFFHAKELGQIFLDKANKRGIERVWLTSETWNPTAAQMRLDMQQQVEGILTVSIKPMTMKLKVLLSNFMREEIIRDWKCSMWLWKYLKNENEFHHCEPIRLSSDHNTLHCAKNHTVGVKNIVQKLSSSLPSNIGNLIDAVAAVSHAIKSTLEKNCVKGKKCTISESDTKFITNEMFGVSFENEQRNIVSFDKFGDPRKAFYTIENLQIINGMYRYVPVGNWNLTASKRLKLNVSAIVWPRWFRQVANKKSNHPTSRCSENCPRGTYYYNKNGCCWQCAKCEVNFIASSEMSKSCKSCGNYSHTVDNIQCIKTTILWLEIKDHTGKSITVISAAGMVVLVILTVILIRLRELAAFNDSTFPLVIISCFLVMATCVNGSLYVLEPTQTLCQGRNALFFLLLMMYSSILLNKTQTMKSHLHEFSKHFLKGSLVAAHVVSMMLLLLVEAASVTVWLNAEQNQLREFREADTQGIVKEIWIQCVVYFTAPRLISIFIPLIVLIIATFWSFQELNLEHSFHERKLLCFCSMISCGIVIGFLPTFNYKSGILKAMVMAFAISALSATFLACLIIPKVYVAVMRYFYGKEKFPLKKENATEKKKKNKEKRRNKKNKKKEREKAKAKEKSEKKEQVKQKRREKEKEMVDAKTRSYSEEFKRADIKKYPIILRGKVKDSSAASLDKQSETMFAEDSICYQNMAYTTDEVDFDYKEAMIEEGEQPPPYEVHVS